MKTEDKMSLLLVEDEVIIAMSEKMELEQYGYSVHCVTSGEKAVEAVLENIIKIDLILIDIDLGSGIDGTQTAEKILTIKDIPVVFLSSHTEPEIVEKTERLTSYGYVVKNSGIVVLDASIKMAIKLFLEKKERRQIESELIKSRDCAEASERKYRIMSDNIIDSVWVTNEEFQFTYLSPSTEFLYGYTIEEWKTLDWNAFVYPDDAKIVFDAFDNLKTNKINKSNPVTVRVYRKDGSLMWVEFLAKALFDENGNFIGLTGVTRDVTERIKAEQKYEILFNEMLDGFALHEVIFDSSGIPADYRFLNINPAFERMTGLKANEIVGRTVLDIMPDTERYWIETYGKVAVTGEPVFFENYSAAIGKYFKVTAFRPAVGQFVCIFSDITDRKKAEDEAAKQLAEKEILLREVHHRVKNNIANVEAFLSLQAGSTSDSEVKKALFDAVGRVQSIRVLYDKLLLTNEYTDTAIKNYIESLITSLVAVYDLNNNIIVKTDISDFVISSKKGLSVGIIINELLTNVFKYAFIGRDNGIVSVSVDKIQNKVTLAVKDNGVGIAERRNENKSPGFGFTIVKMIVEQLGGSYNIVNDNGTESIVQFEV
ncbi:MAG TPA: PAS domain S-box protein [Spirochaetota bacterium]|nr:PAS domain S-box protein [Spirochaetota bacterium]